MLCLVKPQTKPRCIEFMRAYTIDGYGSPDALKLSDIPDPPPAEGRILIEVKAFGINRSELYTRQGHSGDAVTLPRVLGIECVGQVIDGGGTDLLPGQTVAAAMGNMGRLYDGGYAEKASIPRNNVYPLETDLDWETLGALPETYLTAWGVTMEAVGLQAGQSLLIRGGTSSVGRACFSIARDLGCTVVATTRSEEKKKRLLAAGMDHVLIDDGNIADELWDLMPNGVNGVIELVGTETTIKDSLLCAAPKGTVGMVGFLGNSWDYQFFPWMPSTVKLTIYSSETLTTDYATPVLQNIVDKVQAGFYSPNIYQVFSFDGLPEAHRVMESNAASGKLVVVLD